MHHPLVTRELTFLHEHYQQGRAHDLKHLLRQMKAATDRARQQGATCLPQPERDAFVASYDVQLLATGLAANPPPAAARDEPRRCGRRKQSPARNLLERLWLGREQVLAFLDDLRIPFDNNQTERDLRMLKVQLKISGCFRAHDGSGAHAVARIRGYLSTVRTQGVAQLVALATVFAGQPLYPNFA